MVSLIDRVNSIGTNKAQRSVGFGFGSNWSGIVGTLASRDVDLTDTKYSAALAYVFMYPVRVCVDLYSNAVPLISHEIVYNTTHDPKNDKIVASSEDVGVSRLRIMEVFNDHRRQYNIDFLNALTHEYMLYNSHAVELLRPENEVLAQAARQHNRATGLKVLRGLGLSLQAYDGAIQYFQYNDDSGSVMLSPHDVAYDRGYNPFNDYYGVPLVYSILDDLNILNDLYRYLDRLLSKADRPDVIAAFKDGTFTQNTQAQTQFAEMLERYKHSKSNFFTSNIPIDLLAVPAGQANDQMQVSEATKADIFAAFGVSPALVGDNQATTYQEGTNAYANWIRVKVLPLLINIENFINDNLMERFGLDRYYRFRFNTEKYEFVTDDDRTATDVANAKFQDGKITLKQWSELVGMDCDAQFQNHRFMDGILVPPEAVNEIWKLKYPQPPESPSPQGQAPNGMPMQSDKPLALPAPTNSMLALDVLKKKPFSESDVTRDDDGKFGSGGGKQPAPKEGESDSSNGDKPKLNPITGKPDGAPRDTPKPQSKPVTKETPPWAKEKQRVATDVDGYTDYGHIEYNAANDSAKTQLRDLSETHVKNLTTQQSDAAWIYSGSDYATINSDLRSGKELQGENQSLVRNLDIAMERNTLGHNAILYRGISGDFGSYFRAGDTFTDNSYVSTSFDQNTAITHSEGGTMMRIRAASNQNGIALESVSQYAEEHEFLLPRETNFRIIEVSQSPKTGRYYIDAEIIGSNS